jgi:hypothetical protein
MSNNVLTDEINEIITRFHNNIFKILKICQKIEPNNLELESLRGKLGLARDLDPLLIINRCKDKVWHHREQILSEDDEFFLKNKFSEYIKNDENKSFMYSMVNLIKTKYKEMSEPEKRGIWKLIQTMLCHVVEYKKAINDHI